MGAPADDGFALRELAAPLGALAALAVASAWLGTRHGVGLSPDSVNYLRAAHSLLDGEGLRVVQSFHYRGPVPMTHWPPLFPAILAAGGWLGFDPAAFGRAWNALLLGLNAALVGGLVGLQTRSRPAALAACLIFLGNPEVVLQHQMLWTEPTSFAATFLALGLVWRHLAAPATPLWVGAAACAAAAAMTRYASIAVVAACGLALLLLSREPWPRRLRQGLGFGAISCAPLALWALRNRRLAGGATYDEPLPALLGFDQVAAPLLRSLEGWLWPFAAAPGPPAVAALLAGACALGALVAAAALARAGRSGARGATPADPGRLPTLMGLFAICHLAFLYGTVAVLFGAWTPSPRHWVPASAAVLIAAVCLAARALGRRPRPRLAAPALALSLAALLAGDAARALDGQLRAARDGLGLNALRWKRSPLIEFARRLPPQAPVFTNSPAVWVHARRENLGFVPVKRQPQRPEPNPEYEDQLRDMGRRLAAGGGAVVLFDDQGTVWPQAAELRRALPLEVVLRADDGQVLAPRSEAAR